MIFTQLNPGPCRTYLIADEKSKEAVLVDPVLEHVQDYIKTIERQKLILTHVIDTHTHADHISGGASLKDQLDCEYVMHAKAPARCVTFHLTDGFECRFGDIHVKVLSTPGHTKDSVTLLFPDLVLTGDVLFLDDAGAAAPTYQEATRANIGTVCNGFSDCPIISWCIRPMSTEIADLPLSSSRRRAIRTCNPGASKRTVTIWRD